MSNAKPMRWWLLWALSLLLAAAWVWAAENPPGLLTLADAERMAVATDPAIARFAKQAGALADDAVADGQLPDPQFKLGIFNMPLDTFDVEQEPVTQLRAGLQQAFPRGRTLRYKREQTEAQADAETARGKDQARQVVRSVRESFLEVYFQVQAGAILRASRALFAALAETTEAHYAAGRDNQQDVIRAQLELSRLDDRETRILSEEEVGRAELAQWLGERAYETLAPAFPPLPEPPPKSNIQAALANHPAMQIEHAQVARHDRGARIAREQYKPGWSLGVEYRKRFGRDPDGDSRADFMAAMVTVDLPLFTDKRQDRRLAASQQQAMAARDASADRLRELASQLAREYALWQRLGERQTLYDGTLLPEAKLNAEASLKAYQSGVTDFTTLMRARLTELDTRLQGLQVRVDRAKAQTRLLYLAGEG